VGTYHSGKGKHDAHHRTGHAGSEGELRDNCTFNFGTRWGWVVSATPRPLNPWERDLVPTIQEAGWAPWQVWTGAENLTSTSIWCLPVQPIVSHYTNYLALRGRCYSVYARNVSSCAETWLRIT
jgi:hypothetical protein